jgi:hypothetical protein
VGESQEAAEFVESLSHVELPADPAAEGLVGEPAQGVDGAQQFAVFEECLGEGVLAGPGRTLATSSPRGPKDHCRG